MFVIIVETGEYPDEGQTNVICHCNDENSAINTVTYLKKVLKDKGAWELCKVLGIDPDHTMFFDYQEVKDSEYIHSLLDTDISHD